MLVKEQAEELARKVIKTASDMEEVRRELRLKAQKDLFFLCKYVIGYEDLSDGIHREMCDVYMRSHNTPFTMLLYPRGLLKTSVLTVGGILWQVIQDQLKLCTGKIIRGVDCRFIIGGETISTSEGFLKDITAVVTNNEMFKFLFPEFIPSDKWMSGRGGGVWTQERIDFPNSKLVGKKEGCIQIFSHGQTKVSKHYDDFTIDDAINDENTATKELRDKTDTWARNLLPLRNDGSSSRIRWIGTRWHFDDHYGRKIRNEQARKKECKLKNIPYKPVYNILVKSIWANKEKTKTIWPERFTLEVVEQLKAELKDLFYNHYENNPISQENAQFKREYINYIHRKNLPLNMNYFAGLDMADEATTSGDFSVLTIAGFDEYGKMYVVEINRGHFSTNDILTMCYNATKRWKLKKLGVETTGFQKTILRNYKEQSFKNKWDIPWVPINRGKSSKLKLHLSIQPRVQRGDLYVVDDLTEAENLIEELIQIPKGVNDDIADTLAFINSIAYKPDKIQLFEPSNEMTLDSLYGSLTETTSEGLTWENIFEAC